MTEIEQLTSDLKFTQKALDAAMTAVENLRGENEDLRSENESLRKDADLYQQIQIAAGSLPDGWEISLRIENGFGGVDLIDPYGTVIDLDSVDESLSESISSAVTYAVRKA